MAFKRSGVRLPLAPPFKGPVYFRALFILVFNVFEIIIIQEYRLYDFQLIHIIYLEKNDG